MTVFFGRRRGFCWAFSSLTLTSTLFLFALNCSLPLFDQRRSVKGLASVLKSRLQPEDEVAGYHAYYQDLPVYLQRRIIVVHWKGELEFGTEVEDASNWMMDDAEFWRRWNGSETIYMVTSRKTCDKLRAESDQKFYLIAKTGYDVLLSNKQPRPSSIRDPADFCDGHALMDGNRSGERAM